MVTGLWILEQDSVLALDDEVCNVEGSKVHPLVVVWRIVSGSIEMVQARGKVYDQVAVDKNLQLADPIFEVVYIEALEGKKDRSGCCRDELNLDYKCAVESEGEVDEVARRVTGNRRGDECPVYSDLEGAYVWHRRLWNCYVGECSGPSLTGSCEAE